MDLYYNIKSILERRLQRCIKNNTLNYYLFGLNSMFLKENPRDSKSDHDFFSTMIVYNEFNLKYPSLKLDQRYVMELINQLDESGFLNIYVVYESLCAQIKIEEKGWSSFSISKPQLLQLLKKIETILEENKDYFKKYSYMKGNEYKDGVYEYIQSSKHDLYDYSKKTL